MIDVPFGQGYWKERETSIEAASRPERRAKKNSLMMTDARLPAMRPGAFDAARSPSPMSPTSDHYFPKTAGKGTGSRFNYNKLVPGNSYG